MICFVVALKKEAESLLNSIKIDKEFFIADKPAYSFTINNKKCVLAISGIGKVSSALTTQLLIDTYHPSYVFNFGTCGGTNNSVEVLKYYLVDQCCQYDFDLTKLDDVSLGYIQEYDRVFFDTYTNGIDFLEKSKIATADKFTSQINDINAINNIGCSLCDMEAGAIAQVCTSNNIPLVVVKGITDIFGSETAQEQFYKNLNIVGSNFPNVIFKVIDIL